MENPSAGGLDCQFTPVTGVAGNAVAARLDQDWDKGSRGYPFIGDRVTKTLR